MKIMSILQKKVYFRAQAKTRLPPASVSKIADSISLPPSHSKDFIVWLWMGGNNVFLTFKKNMSVQFKVPNWPIREHWAQHLLVNILGGFPLTL